MRTVVIDPISQTTHQLRFLFGSSELSTATGFIYERRHALFLITNWHTVTCRHAITGECLDKKHLAVPDRYSAWLRRHDPPLQRDLFQRGLYADDRQEQPVWLEHPEHGRNVDVVALELPQDVVATYALKPINGIAFDSDVELDVADDAFVVGYQFQEPTDLHLPIWKRASIATEPRIDVDGLPKLLLDTATRPGLSGSPVIMQRVGVHGATKDGHPGPGSFIGRARRFLGVYSGRIGTDELKAQLGIVWKERVIDEIIDGAVFGKAPSDLRLGA